MINCNLSAKWEGNMDELSDSEFDEFVDHSGLCELHAGILADYERSILPLLQVSLPEKIIASDRPWAAGNLISFLDRPVLWISNNINECGLFLYRFWLTWKSRVASNDPIVSCVLSAAVFALVVVIWLQTDIKCIYTRPGSDSYNEMIKANSWI